MPTSAVYQPVTKPQFYSSSCERVTSPATGFEQQVRSPKSTEKSFVPRHPVMKSSPKMTCLCAPTTHAGSFRCRLHRAVNKSSLQPHGPNSQQDNLCTEVKSRVSHIQGTNPVGKVFSRLSAMEERSKGESSLSTIPPRSKNLKPSRLSRVTFSQDIKEEEYNVLPVSTVPLPALLPKISIRVSSIESVSSIRLMAIRKYQRLLMEDNLRVKLSVHSCSQPILSQ